MSQSLGAGAPAGGDRRRRPPPAPGARLRRRSGALTDPRPRLHVDATGSGPVVALAHGFAGSARNFGAQARVLAGSGHRAIRYDARGHARSDAPDDPAAYTPATFVDDLASALGDSPEPVVVGGLSMGATTALRFALARPDRVRGLVLAAFPEPPANPGSLASRAVDFADAIERDGLDAAGARFVWGPAARLDPGAARFVRQGFLEHPAHGLAHTLRGVIARQPAVDELAGALRTLDVPALVIVGGDDRGSVASSRALVAALPRAGLVVVPGAGHVVNLAAPAAFNAALVDFVGALPWTG